MQKLRRRSYHSDFKLAVKLDCIPMTVLAGLPRSSLHRFKSHDPASLVGADLSSVLDSLDLLKEISRSTAALATARAVLRVASFVRSLGLPFHAINSIKIPELRRSVVAFVDRIKSSLPLASILKLLGLSYSRFHSWATNARPCLSSPLDRCRRSYPNQLTSSELKAIRKAFLNPDYSHWPASSIAWQLVNSNIVCAHVRTITRYAKLLGFYNAHLPHRSRKRGSLSAASPNQAWHMDVTILRTMDNQKAFLQLILDNCSHKIIAWKDSLAISGLNSMELLRSAFSSLTTTPSENISLIVDGGSENNNSIVHAYLDTVPIRKLIAQVDVSFSNSLIEAVNKILKYRYLFRIPIPDLEHLHTAVEATILDYNDRPHYALHGLTPNQVYDGQAFDKAAYRERILEAQRRRITENHHACPPCTPLNLEAEEVRKC